MKYSIIIYSMQIKSINMVGEWNYVNNSSQYENKCSICKKLLTSITYDDSVIKGKCNHLFHEKCFQKVNVISNGITLCPIDGNEFIRDSNFYGYNYGENLKKNKSTL